MKRTLAWALLALCLLSAVACAEGGEATFPLRFEEGFTLSLPEGWVSYPAGDGDVRYALGDGTGTRYLYIASEPTVLTTFEALQAAVESREDFEKPRTLSLHGQPFAAFIAPALNASGCATLLNGRLLTFLFTPQDDSDYMLAVAQIMDSFRAE